MYSLPIIKYISGYYPYLFHTSRLQLYISLAYTSILLAPLVHRIAALRIVRPRCGWHGWTRANFESINEVNKRPEWFSLSPTPFPRLLLPDSYSPTHTPRLILPDSYSIPTLRLLLDSYSPTPTRLLLLDSYFPTPSPTPTLDLTIC